jgi:hypothetical protein
MPYHPPSDSATESPKNNESKGTSPPPNGRELKEIIWLIVNVLPRSQDESLLEKVPEVGLSFI